MVLVPNMNLEKKLIVSEIFGPTFQGEGRFIGQPAIFLRLGVCNLSCGFCDTKYTWDFKNYPIDKYIKRMYINEVYQNILDVSQEKIKRLVITGGEPMLQVAKVIKLIGHLPVDWTYEIETAGTVPFIESDWINNETGLGNPDNFRVPNIHFNVSPKLENSGNDFAKAIDFEVLDSYVNPNKFNMGYGSNYSADFKFIVGHPIDMIQVKMVVEELNIIPSRVFISPMGITSKDIIAITNLIADMVIESGWNLTTRLHILAWENERGR